MTVVFVLLAFVSFFAIGWLLLEGVVGRARRSSWRATRAFTSVALGFLATLIASFSLEQLGLISLSSATLMGLIALLVLGAEGARRRLLRRSPPTRGRGDAPSIVGPSIAFGVAAAGWILATRHAPVLWPPLSEWDVLFYHLPFAQQIHDGGFPGDIGRSYALQREAAYPQALFFLYGLLLRLPGLGTAFALPKVVALALNAINLFLAYQLGAHRLRVRGPALVLAIVCFALVVWPRPAMQGLTTTFLLLALLAGWPLLYGPVRPRYVVVVAALFSGVYWTTYLGLPLFALFWLAVCAARCWRARGVGGVREALVLGFAFVAFIAPHLLRNLIVANNPLYPALLDKIGGVGVTAWWLKNRGVATPIVVELDDLPSLFFDHRWPQMFVLAGLLALVAARRARAADRIVALVVGLGFVVLWWKTLQFTDTPVTRYLMPLVPLAALGYGRALQDAWRDGRPFAFLAPLAGMVPLSLVELAGDVGARAPELRRAFFYACGALLVAALFALRRARPPSRHPLRWTLRLFLAPLAAAPLLAAGDVAGIDEVKPLLGDAALAGVAALAFAWLLHLAATRSGRKPLVPLAAALGVVFALTTSGWALWPDDAKQRERFADWQLGFRGAIEWMNENLPEDALVLTTEDRLYPLKRRSVAPDHRCLEPLYQATEPGPAFAALHACGVTHLLLVRSIRWGPFDAFGRRLRRPDWYAYVADERRMKKAWLLTLKPPS
jgi:hypothetical protein